MYVGGPYSFFNVCSGERRLRRSSDNILLPTSDERSLAGGGAESYRSAPGWGPSPELRVLTQKLSDSPTESDNQNSLSSQKEGHLISYETSPLFYYYSSYALANAF